MKWTANIILGAAFFVLIAGVIFGNTFQESERLYITTFSVIVAFVFAGIGAWMRYTVKKRIDETTIIHLDRKGRHP